MLVCACVCVCFVCCVCDVRVVRVLCVSDACVYARQLLEQFRSDFEVWPTTLNPGSMHRRRHLTAVPRLRLGPRTVRRAASARACRRRVLLPVRELPARLRRPPGSGGGQPPVSSPPAPRSHRVPSVKQCMYSEHQALPSSCLQQLEGRCTEFRPRLAVDTTKAAIPLVLH